MPKTSPGPRRSLERASETMLFRVEIVADVIKLDVSTPTIRAESVVVQASRMAAACVQVCVQQVFATIHAQEIHTIAVPHISHIGMIDLSPQFGHTPGVSGSSVGPTSSLTTMPIPSTQG